MKITLVFCPDGNFEAIYVDGKLASEGDCTPAELLELLKVDFDEVVADGEWVMNRNMGMPKDLKKVKVEE